MIKELVKSLIIYCSLIAEISCTNSLAKYQDQIKVSDQLIESIKRNDTLSIKKMIGIELYYLGLNNESLIFRVNKIRMLLQHFEISSKRKYTFREYTKTDPNLVDILIPLESNKREANSPQIIISFAKYIDKDKILNFDVIEAELPVPDAKAPNSK